MTPYELSLHIKAFNENRKQDQEEKLTLTYLGAYWQRVKKMPRLKDILGKTQPKKSMSSKQMLTMVRHLNAAFGGEVKKNGD